MPDIPKGFDTSSCSETTLPIGSAVTGRSLCKIWGFEGQFRGRDLKRFWMRCMMCLFVYLELQLECVIGLVIPSVMLYPYRCSWMRSTFVHHSYLSKVYPLYAINASC